MKQEEICLSSAAEWNAQQDISNARNGVPIPKSLSLERSYIWLNYGEENQIKCWGYCRIKWKYYVSWLLILLSVGLVRLLFYWKPVWWVQLTHELCTLDRATVVVLKTMHEEYFVRTVQYANVSEFNEKSKSLIPEDQSQPIDSFQAPSVDCAEFAGLQTYRFFTHRKLKYLWDCDAQRFEKLPGLENRRNCAQFHNCTGLTPRDAAVQRGIYGLNQIVVQLKPILHLLFFEILNPFYVFQIFSVILWYTDEYTYYATCIILMSTISIASEIYQIRTNQRQLRDTVHSTDNVNVFRSDQEIVLPSTSLVPGDVICIPPHGCVLQCDAVLLAGNCIVNESMLTGESVPVTKTPIPCEPIPYHPKEHAKHTLFSGTRVLQTRFYPGQPVRAVVLRTGFLTMKGQLVRSIMYPKPVDFQFTKDLLKMVGVLGLIAFGGFLYAIVIMARRGNGVHKILLRSLDIITIVVPPALPAAMTIGIMLARQRLKKKQIFCIAPSVINTCGGINVVVFDKTGTLTEDGLDFHCSVPCEDQKFGSEIIEFQNFHGEPLVHGMACCHSLTVIQGKLSGDPLDQILFDATGWRLEEPQVEESAQYDVLAPTVVHSPVDQSVEFGILRQFPFSSSLQRMSVIVRQLGEDDMILFCKGAPEKIASLSLASTIPANFFHVLHSYTKHGYRVLAMGYKRLQLSFVASQRIKREEVETELIFLGLLILENRLKPETEPVIEKLHHANIRSIMCTGDNLQTAISVASECQLVQPHQSLYSFEIDDSSENTPKIVLSCVESKSDLCAEANSDAELGLNASLPYQLATTGTSYMALRKHFPALLSKVVVTTAVFARMSPENKAQLVSDLQDLGYVAAMVGDGANDCGALKAAHAGISLSEAEASIASPFTSKHANIECVPVIIREGRAALVTSFGVFKYMAGYSLCQFLSVSLLYWIASNVADFQFLYIDLFLITLLAVVFGYTEAADELDPTPPPTRILSPDSVLSLVCQILVMAVFQVFIFDFITHQPWFVPFTNPGDENNFDSFQVTAVFLLSLFQYIALVIVYSKAHPYRKTILNNWYLTGCLILVTGVSMWIAIHPPGFLTDLLSLKMPPETKFRYFIVLLGFFNVCAMILTEKAVIEWLFMKVLLRRGFCVKGKEKTYESLISEVSSGPSWVPRKISSAHQLTSLVKHSSSRSSLDECTGLLHSPSSPAINTNGDMTHL